MFKLTTFGILLFIYFGYIKDSNSAPNMKLFGVLVAEPCVLETGDDNLLVDFKSIMMKDIYKRKDIESEDFHIRLSECDITQDNSVIISFTGVESISQPNMIALSPDSVAEGIAIGLKTSDGMQVKINDEGFFYKLTSKKNDFSFKAYVRGDPDLISSKSIYPGDFNAHVTFKLTYQ